MNTKSNRLISIFTVVLTAAVFLLGWPSTNVSARSVLPEEIVVSETFYPGYGAPIGQVQRVRGEVVGVHAHAAGQGFRLRPRNNLYKDDTIYTMETGKIRFKMNDGSILSLASETKLELNKSVYDQQKKSRSSFLNMAFGKARFLVVKMINFKRSEFRVKTPTAVCGVRGSDYVIEASGQVSTFIALEDTTIEVYNPQFPDSEPVVLNAYEMSRVYLDGYPSEPVKLTPEEIEKTKAPFISVAPDESEPEADEVQAGEGTGTGVKKVAMSDVLVPKEAIVQLPENFEVRDMDQEDIGKSVKHSGVTEDRPSMIYDDIRGQAKEGDQWPSGFPGSPE
jgi:hypothetical protein